MKFNTLVKKYSFPEVSKRLLELYPDQKKSIDGYEKAYKFLKRKKPKDSDVRIRVDILKGDYDEESYVRVDGWDGRQGWAIEYTPWSEWLGMGITRDSSNRFPGIDILVHCLWEMTWSGFDEKSIQADIKKFSDIGKEIGKDSK